MDGPLRVLLVDSRPPILRATTSDLEGNENQVTVDTTNSGDEASSLLTEHSYDYLLTAYELSDGTGIELLDRVREPYPDLPVALYTDQGSEQLASEAIAAGVTEYIPVDDIPNQTAELASAIESRIQTEQSDEDHRCSDAVYELLADTATDMFWTYDTSSETAWFSEGIEIFGYKSETVAATLDWFYERIHPSDRDRVEAHIDALLANEETAFERLEESRGEFSTEFRFRQADGSYADCCGHGLVQFDHDTATNMLGTITDVTAQKQRERELEAVQTRMEIALEAIEATIWEWDSVSDTVTTHPDPHHVLDAGIENVEDFLEPIHPADEQVVQEALETALEENASYHVEFRVETDDGIRWVEDFGECWTDERDSQYMIGIAKDITERKEREQELQQNKERLAVALEVANAGVWEWDPETDAVVWHESTERLVGLEPGTFEGTREAFTSYVPEKERPAFNETVDAAVAGREPFDAEFPIQREDGEERWHHTWAEYVDIDGISPRYIGVVTDITELKQYEQTLRTLHEATRELYKSDNSGEVSRRIVYAANSLLDISGAAMVLYDPERVVLEPEIVSGETRYTDGPQSLIESDDGGQLWDAFIAETARVYPDISDELANGLGLAATSAFLLPLGDHGLFVIAAEDNDQFDERTRDLAEMLAANAEAALDRIRREQELERRDRELRERAARLEQLDEVNERVRKIIHKLIRATTRTEIEELVCSELARAERFELSCIGEYDPHRDEVRVQTAAGEDEVYIESVSFNGEHGSEPLLEAARTRECVIVDDIARDFRDEEWRQQALRQGFQSVLALPIRHDDIPYGVLAIYANSAEAFDTETVDVFTELGTAIAHVLRTVVQREALESDQQIELEFEIDGGETTLFELSEYIEAELVIERILSQEESYLAYGTIIGSDRDELRRATARLSGVDQARILSIDNDRLRIELQITGTSTAQITADHGGEFGRLHAINGNGTIAVEFPTSAKITEFIEMFVTRYPNSELAARRDLDEPGHSSTDIIDAAITSRQQEVLQAAYHSGFFEWPRDSTGEEIADSLEVSATTFRETLRRAERNLIDWYVGAR